MSGTKESLDCIYLHGGKERLEIFVVVLSVNLAVSTLVEVKILFWRQQAVFFFLLERQTFEHFVENVVIALVLCLSHNSRLFQQVLGDFSTNDHTPAKIHIKYHIGYEN